MQGTREDPICFVVDGEAVQQGSMNAVVPKYGNGKPVRRHRRGCPGFGVKEWGRENECGCPIMVNHLADNHEALDNWRKVVGWVARNAYKGDILRGALAVEALFVLPRPKGHFGTGRNAEVPKDSSPAYPATTPDLDKLTRSIGDALKGVLWTDDSLIVRWYVGKDYAAPGEGARVEFRVWRMGQQTIGDMIEAGVIEPTRPADEYEQLTLVA